MQLEGNIRKMRTQLTYPVSYFLPVGENKVEMNKLVGKDISMNFTGQINCVSCGKITKTSFNQGFCYNCMQTAPEASESIIRPELSKSHLGIARDMEWAKKHDLIDHFVYLAVANDIKVGVTREHQIPTRWIDQGASFAIKLAKTPNRHIAGILEIFLKKHISDKTNWRAMLKNEIAENIDLQKEKEKIIQFLPAELQKYVEKDNEITSIKYPVNEYPKKLKSVSFDKIQKIEGMIKGIKGQYLIFDDDTVLNIRKHNGYFLQINY
ncbi:DUF2797 domain-containing protein [Maribellus comscasis]|uniref:DUF2797 domain-containing protein n=1 Tax=Maribellus comscasis TaxID=2681766 RepID=A0A6I6JVM3_9BACT|nr:DUF2797 domain-containing protein [Maribellus comscasis]QGY44212.1 DUF2797 domain-containing protein [Maribellus comscasis]